MTLGSFRGKPMTAAFSADKDGFQQTTIKKFDDLFDHLKSLEGPSKKWVYRGQSHCWPLTTTLERRLWEIGGQRAGRNEQALVREFRRRIRGEHAKAGDDPLYWLALMQHHGAPTRLLDCTYSPYVALQVAIRDGRKKGKEENNIRSPVIWCFEQKEWIREQFKPLKVHYKITDDPNDRHERFRKIYDTPPLRPFVMYDNAFLLNERLAAHQGVFLFPVDVNSSFIDNIQGVKDWNLESNVQKLRLEFDEHEHRKAVHELKRMNVSSTVLYSGLDGFAKSLGEEFIFYDDIYGKAN
jgi:FRG domain-containing protein